jgi:hypothetical protein
VESQALSDEVFTDIANAMMRLRHAFMRHNLNPPKSLELGSHDDGARLLSSLPKSLYVAQPRMDKSDPEWCLDLVGIEVRFPAHWRAKRRGGMDAV